jgi:hypothetical protein
MAPKGSTLRGIDPTRLGIAASRPGIDPRVWVCFGRVKDVAWDAESGGLVSVDIVGGPLDGERDVVCSVATTFAGTGAISSSPIQVGAVMVVVIPEGDANVDPQVIGYAVGPDVTPPVTVAGQAMADLFASSHVLGDPEHDGNVELKALRVVAEAIKLVVAEPTQAFVRGGDFTDALKTWLDGVDQLLTTMIPLSTDTAADCVGPLLPLAPFFTGFATALQALKTSGATFRATLVPGQALSTKLHAE